MHNEELHDVHSPQDIIRIIKPKRVRRTGHAARTGERRNAYRVLVGKSEEGDR
jgi:hypothetical protein